MLTPKPKVWKVLKKQKRKWYHKWKQATTTTKTKVTKVRAELKTFGTADLKRICYVTTLMPFK